MEGQGGGGGERERNTETEVMTHWEKVVALLRADFGEERLAEETMWQVVVLIPKGKGDYHGIGFFGGDVEGSGGGS